VLTGDGRVDEIRRSHGAKLNVVQCAGSMTPLAKAMEEKYGIPFIRVSFFGIEDTASALYEVAEKLGDAAVKRRTQELVKEELGKTLPMLKQFKQDLQGKRAGLYVGGAFKAFSLVRALRQLGVTVALAGTQTGSQEEYEELQAVCDENTSWSTTPTRSSWPTSWPSRTSTSSSAA
jgi:nitrogenase molybdenum-cofactor synthesis protein NifE